MDNSILVFDTEVEITDATTIDINGNVESKVGTTTQTGIFIKPLLIKMYSMDGLSVKNGSTSLGFVEFLKIVIMEQIKLTVNRFCYHLVILHVTLPSSD